MYQVLLSLALCAASAVGSSNIQLNSVAEVQRVFPNTSIVLPCEVTGPFNPYSNQIVWTKRSAMTPSNHDGVQINMGTLLRAPFKNTARHAAVLTQSEGSVSIGLSITGIRVEDDGVYTCQVLDDSGSIAGVSHSLTVAVAVDTLSLVANTSWEQENSTKVVYQFEELKDSYLSCRSSGGNPKPTLHVTRAGSDITSELEKVDEQVEPVGDEGLQRVYHQVQLVTWKFRATQEDSGKRIKCVAKIPRSPELRTTVLGHMDVTFAPVFNCTSSPLYLTPSTNNLTIVCWVRAHPSVDKDAIYWTSGTVNATNISTAGNNSIYETSVKEVNTQWTVVTLAINPYNSNITDPETYTLHVTNPVDTRHHDVMVSQATTTQSTTTTSTTTTVTPIPTRKVKDKPDVPDHSVEGSGAQCGAHVINIMLIPLVTLMCLEYQ